MYRARVLPTVWATVILDPPTALLFGCAIALVSSRLLQRAPDAEIPRTALIGALWSLFYGLCVGWFYFVHPDWMFAYLKDSREVALVPSYVAFVLTLVANGAIGAYAGAVLLAKGRRALAFGLAAGALATLALFFWLQWKQYMLLGTYDEFHAGRAVPIQSVGAMQTAMNVSGALWGISAVALCVWRFLEGRKAG